MTPCLRHGRFPIVAAVLAITSHASAADTDAWFGRDKFNHFVVSTSIATETYLIAAHHTPARWHALAIGAGVTLAAGATKEGVDALGRGTPSWRDLAWDAIGAAAGLGVAWGIDLLIRGVNDEHPLFRAAEIQF